CVCVCVCVCVCEISISPFTLLRSGLQQQQQQQTNGMQICGLPAPETVPSPDTILPHSPTPSPLRLGRRVKGLGLQMTGIYEEVAKMAPSTNPHPPEKVKRNRIGWAAL